ncbi:MAG: PAS domain S-box protein [Nitrospirae bacterium]|nr:PAS domain S-box protein [Nitrospirota bacterium]
MRKTSNEWETAFNSISELISIHDKDFNIVRVNNAFSDVLKKKRSELIGKKCYEVIHGTSEPRSDCPYKRTMETGEPFTEEFFETRLEIYLQVSTSPIFDEKGEILGAVHIAKDVTEHKKSELALQKAHIENELLFKTTLLQAQSETSIDGILVVDNKGKVISYNNLMREMWNIPQELWNTGNDDELLQYAITQLNEPDEFLKKVKYLYANREEKSRDEISLKDGRYFDRYSSSLIDANGNYYGRVWYFRDITEGKMRENKLRNTERELKLYAEELMESNAALKAFLKHKDEDRREFEYNILSNVKQLVLPYMEKLKNNKLTSKRGLTYVNIVESNLKEIVSPFSRRLSSKYLNFTPKEIQISDLIIDGKQDKEIMEILNISIDTIKTHRRNIRKKLGITNKKINLKTKLMSLIQ